MSVRDWQTPFRGHAILIWGALGATLLGALAALQMDPIAAAGDRLTDPIGQTELLRTAATASLTGLLLWVVCALVTRAITRAAIKPYEGLAERFERLADGAEAAPLDPRGQAAGALRLARAVDVLHQRALAIQRSEALLQTRYESLYQEHSDERRLLMGLMMSGRLDPQGQAPALQSRADAPPVGLERHAPTSAAPEAAGGPTARTGRYDSLYQDAEERRLLMEMLLTGQLDAEDADFDHRPADTTPFGIPERPSAEPRSAGGPSSHSGMIVDPTDRMRGQARRAEASGFSDLEMNFAVVRR